MIGKQKYGIHRKIEVSIVYRFAAAIVNTIEKMIPDSIYIRLWYYRQTGKHLDLRRPTTIDEKLQWMKIHYRKEEQTKLVDKYEVKKIVGKIIGEEYIIPTYRVWNKVDEINISDLPDKFVLKCTHDNKSAIICRNKEEINIKEVKDRLRKCFNRNFYYWAREWPYKNVKPRIIAEKLIENSDRSPIVDYKFYCYGGKPRYFMYSMGEAEHRVRNHKFDLAGNSIDYLFKKKPTIKNDDINLPDNLDEMIQIANKLSKDYQHIRVDLYNVEGKIYFGELTFYSGGGIIKIESETYSKYIASLIDLSKC